MKLLSGLIFCFYFTTSGFGQVWIDSEAKWTFDHFNVGETGTWVFEYTQDTIILGIQTQVIQSTKHLYYGSNYVSSTNGVTNYTYTSNDSVFYFKNGHFFLLYDFGAQIGDSWIISIDQNSLCQDTSIVTVVDVGSIIINGQNLRTITLESTSDSYKALNGLCIEKFGITPSSFQENNFGPFPGYQYCSSFDPHYDFLTFRCYEDVSFSNYNLAGTNCDTLTSINETEIINLNIYPNPTDNIVNITSKEPLQQLQVFDIKGTLIQVRNNMNTQDAIVDITHFSSGIYLLHITTQEGVYTQKIQKR